MIRHAQNADLPSIVAIYNAAIPGGMATADLSPAKVTDRQSWFTDHKPDRHPIWVAEISGRITGWLSLSTYYPRPAWDPTAEISVYVHPDHRRKGIARALVQQAIESAPQLGIATLLAIVAGHNEPSLRLLDGLGFERWGLLPRTIHMPHGRRDIVILGLEITPP